MCFIRFNRFCTLTHTQQTVSNEQYVQQGLCAQCKIRKCSLQFKFYSLKGVFPCSLFLDLCVNIQYVQQQKQEHQWYRIPAFIPFRMYNVHIRIYLKIEFEFCVD